MSFNKMEMPDPMVITVCTAPASGDRLEAALRRRQWRSGVSNTSSYISDERRPYFLPLIRSSNACIAFVDFDRSAEEAVETARYLTQNFPGKITVVALSENQGPDNILTAMRAGCSEFLKTPLQESALSELFDRIEQQWLSPQWRSPQAGAVISFLGVKGGVGTTTLAVHLAVYLAQHCNKRTLLIDHHPELGHVSVYLGFDGNRYQFQEVVRNVNRLDSQLLHGFVYKHPNGLSVLSSPDICDGTRTMDQEALEKTLDFLRNEYEYIVMDCNINFEQHNLPVISASQQVYMVSVQEVCAIRNLSRHIDHFALLDTSLEKLEIILNRVSSSDAIQVEQVEKAMKLPVAIRIPNGNSEFVRLANLGEPLAPGSKSTLASSFARWAENVVGVPQEISTAKRNRPLLSLWR